MSKGQFTVILGLGLVAVSLLKKMHINVDRRGRPIRGLPTLYWWIATTVERSGVVLIGVGIWWVNHGK